MASDERNAMAELADSLNGCTNTLTKEGWVSYGKEVRKAQRIIAELAKVETDRYGCPWEDTLVTAFEQSREIAEEGVKND